MEAHQEPTRRWEALSTAPKLVGAITRRRVEAATALGQLSHKRERALAEGDLDTFMAACSDDAVFTSAVAPFRLDGCKAIRAYYEDLFVRYPVRKMATKELSLRFYHDDTVVIANSYAELTMIDREGKQETLPLRRSFTILREEPGWTIVDVHYSLLPHSP